MSATKQQEREALKKIQNIIEGLGGDSYVAAAFEGVLDIAQRNIEDDAMCNPIDRIESTEKRADELEEKLLKAEDDLKQCKKLLKEEIELSEQRAKEIKRLTMTYGEAEDLIEVVRIQQHLSEDAAINAAESMAMAVMGEETEEAKEFAQRYNDKIEQARRCKELDTMLQKYLGTEE